jgi:hypothetical protein
LCLGTTFSESKGVNVIGVSRLVFDLRDSQKQIQTKPVTAMVGNISRLRDFIS